MALRAGFRTRRGFRSRTGGKDGHPFPVPLKTYDESIAVLRRSLDAAKVGDTDKLDGFKRLNGFVRAVESQCTPQADFDAAMTHERRISKSLDGRMVGGGERRRAVSKAVELVRHVARDAFELRVIFNGPGELAPQADR